MFGAIHALMLVMKDFILVFIVASSVSTFQKFQRVAVAFSNWGFARVKDYKILGFRGGDLSTCGFTPRRH